MGEGKEREKRLEKGKKGAAAGAAVQEAKKKAEGKEKDEDTEDEKPPPPQLLPPQAVAAAEEVVVMRVFMDCEGCARKVRRALRSLEGVDDVKADYKTQMVAVKGRGAAAEPTKVVERIYRKCGKKAELIITPRPSPPPLVLLPPPPMVSRAAPEKNKENNKNKDEGEPQVVVAVLNIRMHCEACAQEIKNKILRVKGVHEADPNLVASQVTVKGVFNPAMLAEYVHKRTRKHVTVAAVHVPLPSPPPLADAPSAAENRQNPNQEAKEGGEKEGGKKQKDKENSKTTKSGGVHAAAAAESMVVAVGPTAAAEAGVIGGGGGKVTSERYDANSYYYYHPRYPAEYYAYPPQIFSDENPNACVVM